MQDSLAQMKHNLELISRSSDYQIETRFFLQLKGKIHITWELRIERAARRVQDILAENPTPSLFQLITYITMHM